MGFTYNITNHSGTSHKEFFIMSSGINLYFKYIIAICTAILGSKLYSFSSGAITLYVKMTILSARQTISPFLDSNGIIIVSLE